MMTSAQPEEQQESDSSPMTVKEMMHKTKLIQFFGRTTPIILQNDNGPCPLLSICNILLLRNNLSLSSEVAEVSQEKLLSLVAERLIDSNSNVENKSAEYVENQQQNIADAIDLLPRLATGIDVNIKFTRIDDFEFTRECAIFDLLDIPLYHGWIVDPQDLDTSKAIGSKSYNTLMGELVALETQYMASVSEKNPEEDCVDDVASTKESSKVPVTGEEVERKGDLLEEIELLKTLKLSNTDYPTLENDINVGGAPKETPSTISNGDSSSIVNNHNDDLITFEADEESHDVSSSLEADKEGHDGQMNASVSDKHESKYGSEKLKIEVSTTENVSHNLSGSDSFPSVDQSTSNGDVNEVQKIVTDGKTSESCSSTPAVALESSNDLLQTIAESDSLASTTDGNELVAGEKCISETNTLGNEGEAVMSENVDKDSSSADDTSPKDETNVRQGELIRDFLKSSANQLTIYGLFSLQEGLKERELCVFFRNNHFNTMFKFEGELYILATDQGYLNQPDLVWEKLNEVNGDTVFVNNNFKKFNPENHDTRSWDQQNAMADTADYIAKMDNADTSFNADLQLAIELQQQEFEQQQQQQQQPQRVLPQSPTTSRSGLVVGPQNVHPARPKNSSSTSRQEQKASKDKEKCIVM
nr:ubiquitin carboxyl-terminal hydrolase MINDY-1 isoform X2 [Tanacetum cinerariifolium]